MDKRKITLYVQSSKEVSVSKLGVYGVMREAQASRVVTALSKTIRDIQSQNVNGFFQRTK
jgi:uncharacterized protein (UPF0264 family)